MSSETRPSPNPPQADEVRLIQKLLRARRIAVVGASDDPSRTSHHIASYLASIGMEIIPVNPNHAWVLGRRCYPSLGQIPAPPVELVDVFRRAEFCPDVVRAAVAAGAAAVWLQSGIVSEEARSIAAEARIDFVQDRCLMVEHLRAGR